MDKLPLYILAGGRSRRFGTDKARALIHGRPLIVHVAEMLKPFCTGATVVADIQGKYHDLGIRTVADVTPGYGGPLVGLLTAISDAGPAPWLLVAPCDLAVVSPGWVEALLAGKRNKTQAVAFRGVKWQPFPGLYHRSTASLIAGLLHRGQRSMRSLLDSASTSALGLPSDWPDRIGVNTPDELLTVAPPKVGLPTAPD